MKNLYYGFNIIIQNSEITYMTPPTNPNYFIYKTIRQKI